MEKLMLMNRIMKKPATLLTLAAALGVVGMVSQVQAGTVLTSTNLAAPAFGVDVLNPVAGFSETVNIVDSGGYIIGTLQNSVFQLVTPTAIDPNNGQYVYEETLTEAQPTNPVGHNLKGLSSFTIDNADPLPGFTPGTSLIGWNYSQAGAMGLTGTSADFTINDTGNGSIQYLDNGPDSGTYVAGDPITFFYESKIAPGAFQYSVNDSDAAVVLSYGPVPSVPVPAASSMGLVAMAGLAGLGLLRRRAAAL
jgi:MYXO-CTERM domain-containing protein